METEVSSDGPTILRLKDVSDMYEQRLLQLGIDMPNVNSTILKDMLLGELPELEARGQGRDVFLAFRKDVGAVLSEASKYSEAILLTKQQRFYVDICLVTSPHLTEPFIRGV
jgi:hypothetical protein